MSWGIRKLDQKSKRDFVEKELERIILIGLTSLEIGWWVMRQKLRDR